MNDHSLRIIQIMKDKKMNATQFSEAIGIQRAKMSHITLGRNNPTADVITKIITRFEDINPAWLLIGKGTMKIVPNQPNEEDDQPYEEDDQLNEIDDQPYEVDDHLFKKESLDDVESKKNALPRTYPDASGDNPSVPTRKPQINTPVEGLFHTNTRPYDKNHPTEEVNQAGKATKITEKEIVTYKEGQTRKIEKIVILFSDKTYETFIPES